MKREHKEILPYLYKLLFYEKWFWNECSKCKNDFKNMNGYRYLQGRNWYYICSDCAPSIEDANEYFKSNGHLPPRPEPPKPQTIKGSIS